MKIMRLTETRNLSLVFLFSSFSFSKLRPYFLSKLIPPICQPLSLNPEAWHSFGYPLAFEISIFSVPYALFSKSRKLFRSVTSKLRTFFLTLIFLQNPCGIFLKKKKKVKHQLSSLLHLELVHLVSSHTAFYWCY